MTSAYCNGICQSIGGGSTAFVGQNAPTVTNLTAGPFISIVNTNGNFTISSPGTITNIVAGSGISVANSGAVSTISTTAASAILYVNTYRTNGTSDTAICRYLNTWTNTGENIYWNYVTNVTEGSKITILSNGVYELSVSANPANSVQTTVGFSVNASSGERTTAIYDVGVTNFHRICYVNVNNASAGQWPCSRTVPLASNDVVRVHGNPTDASNGQKNTVYADFSITRIGN